MNSLVLDRNWKNKVLEENISLDLFFGRFISTYGFTSYKALIPEGYLLKLQFFISDDLIAQCGCIWESEVPLKKKWVIVIWMKLYPNKQKKEILERYFFAFPNSDFSWVVKLSHELSFLFHSYILFFPFSFSVSKSLTCVWMGGLRYGTHFIYCIAMPALRNELLLQEYQFPTNLFNTLCSIYFENIIEKKTITLYYFC